MKKEEILKLIESVKGDAELRKQYLLHLLEILDLRDNPFHPLAFINGNPKIGKNVCIGFFSEVNAKGAEVDIGDDCDIASFVTINCADSHKRCIGRSDSIERKNIKIENNVFIGSHTVVKGGAYIGHHSVIAAGTVIDERRIPPYSLVAGNPMKVKEGYYLKKRKENNENRKRE